MYTRKYTFFDSIDEITQSWQYFFMYGLAFSAFTYITSSEKFNGAEWVFYTLLVLTVLIFILSAYIFYDTKEERRRKKEVEKENEIRLNTIRERVEWNLWMREIEKRINRPIY